MKKTAFLVLIIILSSCLKIQEEPEGNKFIQMDEKSALLIEADNAFGLELFREINVLKPDENLMISPLSISVALAMAYNGAEGDTKTEMEQTLKVFGLTTDEINASYEYLISALQSLDKDVVFELANAIFYEKSFPVKSEFIDVNKEVYKAEVSKLDFSSTDAVKTINNWVAGKTNNKITKIIESLNPADVMVLLNAVYFNGIWKTKFEEENTMDRKFYKADGSSVSVPMMYKEDSVAYLKNNLFSAVQLLYGSGKYNMVVFLPENENKVENVVENLTAENWGSWMEDFSGVGQVNITLPRFKYRFETRLNDALKNLGMAKAFSDSEADFFKISDMFIYISSVIHKTYIDVNEKGTEAAAVTAVIFTNTSAGGPSGINFTANRPFVYAITEKDTGAIIFIGKVLVPVYED